MNEDPELQRDNGPLQNRSYSKGRGIRTDDTKRFPVLLIIALILIFAGGIVYFIIKPSHGNRYKRRRNISIKDGGHRAEGHKP